MKRFRKRPILRSPGKIKHWLYRHGYRPKPGSILFSPSLALIYGFVDATKARGWDMKITHEHPDYPSDCRDSPG